MTKVVLIARILLGLPLVVFGLNHFFLWMEPSPEDLSPEGWAWVEAMGRTGYLNELTAAVEVVCGLSFLAGRFVPLALVVFAPVMVNIVAFHLFLDEPINGVMAYVMLALHLFLAWAYWPHFRGVLKAGARPRGSD